MWALLMGAARWQMPFPVQVEIFDSLESPIMQVRCDSAKKVEEPDFEIEGLGPGGPIDHFPWLMVLRDQGRPRPLSLNPLRS